MPLHDDGLHDDGGPADGIYAAWIPAQSNHAIVEFYVEARDGAGLIRTWPAPAVDTNGATLGQTANALYQVDDAPAPGTAPPP